MAVAALACLAHAAIAVELPSKEQPSLLSADQVDYDQSLGVVTARGHVEISQGERILLADTVTYNERTQTVTASGHVSLLEPTGDVAFADYVELTSDLKEGVIRDVRLLMSDGSRIAANGGVRSDDKTDFAKAVYSPCQLCAEDPTRPPLWQLKAVRVTHDQVAHRIQYYDAWLEVYGVPVVYTPYFSQPDPTVKRQSGFLVPTFTLSKNLGATATVPYYFVLGPNSDATFEPIFTTQQGIVLGGEYRQRLQTGEIGANGSITRADRETDDNRTEHNVVRGHIDAFTKFDIDDAWRWGANLNRVSDKTYLRLYGYGSDRTLTSRLYTEEFGDRSYGLGRTLWFQGLRDSDNNDEFPLITPELSYDFVGEPNSLGAYWTGDVGALNLARIKGRDVRRLNGEVGWVLPYISSIGTVTELSATMEADGYWVNTAKSPDFGNPDTTGSNGFTGRLFPQLAAELSYPFARYGENFTQVVTPTAALVIAPEDPNSNSIPNEDSQDFVFDETNLFRPDRSTGIDRADGGQRIDYGLQWSGYRTSGGTASAFIGQSYRFNRSNEFENVGGIQDRLSDYVGRVALATPKPKLDLSYRFQLDSQTLKPHRNEVQLEAGGPDLNTTISYVFLDHHAQTTEFTDREELDTRLRGKLNDRWSGLVFAQRDLQRNTFLTYGTGLIYENECVSFGVEVRRDNFHDREVKPETKLLLRLELKTLGGVGTF